MNELINWPSSRKYVVAVSGGADSMVLLDVLAMSDRGYDLVVAHFDHGMRQDSSDDAKFVEGAAAQYGLPFRSEVGRLGPSSEATARSKRHAFLERVRQESRDSAIVTAHHQDDLIETSLLNLARGTGRRGLAPMQSGDILRPLIRVPRTELRAYAQEHGIEWREDATNADISNPRNFLRHELLAVATKPWRRDYLHLIEAVAEENRIVDTLLEPYLIPDADGAVVLDRAEVRDLPAEVLQEVITSAAYRLNPDIELDRRLMQELADFAKTGQNGKFRPVRATMKLTIRRDTVVVSAK